MFNTTYEKIMSGFQKTLDKLNGFVDNKNKEAQKAKEEANRHLSIADAAQKEVSRAKTAIDKISAIIGD